MRYNSGVHSPSEKEIAAARHATRQMKAAALVITLSFVLVIVLVAVIMLAGHVKIF